MPVEFNFFTGQIHERQKISKYIGKYVSFLEFIDINLLVLSVTDGSITIVLFISTIGTPVRLIASFITICFTLSNGFLKLFSSKLERKETKTKNIEILTKSNLNSVKSIISKAILECCIFGKDYAFINKEADRCNKLKEKT